MLAAERQLPYQGHDGFTPELKSILTRIKYYRLLLRQANGVLLNKKLVQTAQAKADTSRYSGDAREVRGWLREAWEEFRRHQQKKEEQREIFLDQLIAVKHKAVPEEHKKAIEKINSKHKSKQQFM